MSTTDFKVFKTTIDPDKLSLFIMAAGEATACTIDEESWPNRPVPASAPELIEAGI